jgi:predicted lipoprotein with Yx(FWY)xxD motif
MRLIRIGLVAAVIAAVVAGGAAGASGTAIKIEKTPSLGKVIANARGKTLYLFRADHGTTSACYGACATFWPPVLTAAKPLAMTGVKASLLGTTKRKDGKLQVTYKGHPLYTFVKDTKAGMTAGEGSNNFGAKWYALAPSGATIDKD